MRRIGMIGVHTTMMVTSLKKSMFEQDEAAVVQKSRSVSMTVTLVNRPMADMPAIKKIDTRPFYQRLKSTKQKKK